MSTLDESESVYEPYDPSLQASQAVTNTAAISNAPRSSAYVQPDAKRSSTTGTATPPFPILSLQSEYGELANVQTKFFRLDTRYVRSLEGLVRFLSLPLPVIGIILAWVYLVSGVEVWYAAQGFAYLLYVVIVFLIETLLAEVFVHRLVDGIITTLFAMSWLSAAIGLTYVSRGVGTFSNVVPQGAPATFAYVETFIVAFSAVLAFRTWRISGGKNGSPPLC